MRSQKHLRSRWQKSIRSPQRLEQRVLLAGDLIAQWQADNLDVSISDGEAIPAWIDSIGGVEAATTGTPVLGKHALGSRSAVRFDQIGDLQSFVIGAASNPLAGATDFTVTVAFRTDATDLVGTDGQWFSNTGLVDMSQAGLAQDWGLSINRSGQVTSGLGAGFFTPPKTIRGQAGLNDGNLHVATFSRQGSVISLIVDDGPAASVDDADASPRGSIPLTIGAISSGELGFKGDIAEVRIFDGAMTTDEAHDVFHQIMSPIATDDQFFGLTGETMIVDAASSVVANDISYLTEQLTATLATAPRRGVVELAANGSFTYTPNADFSSGVDTFTYRATDGTFVSAETTVTIVVNTIEDQRAIVINELHVNPGVDTELVEFIELHNPSDTPVHLANWFFDSGIAYSFPDDAQIAPHGFHVIAQNVDHFLQKFGVAADGQWEGRLSNEGETVSLRSNLGEQIDRVDFGQGFPWPMVGEEPGYSMELINASFDNQLGGNWRSSVGNQTVVGLGESWKYFKGTEEPSADQTAWRQVDFDDAAWAVGSTPIGFGRALTVATELDDMRRNYTTAYLRKEFHMDDPSTVGGLVFEAFFDDGINVWINGTYVAGRNTVSENVPFDAMATGSNRATTSERIDLPDPMTYLVAGKNVIAVQLLNETLASSDVFLDAALFNTSLRAPGPTPGFENSVLSDTNGPLLRQISHTPSQPTSADDVTIQIRATDSDGVSAITLEYQIVAPGDYIRINDARFSAEWQSAPMVDDGTNGDATAGDSIFTAVISAENHQHRHLVRYRVHAEDRVGDSVAVPYADDPQPNFAYFVYDGIPSWTGADRPGRTEPVTFGTDVMNQLPTYHLIADAEDVRNSQYVGQFEEIRFRGTMVYNGEVYDHIEFRIRGEFSTYVAGKNKWKFFFNRGHEFQAHDNFGQAFEATRRVLNFSGATTPWMPMNRGMAGIGEAIAYRLYDIAGIASPDTNFVQFRVIDDAAETSEDQYEGDLWGLYLSLEHPGGRFLDERNLPDGTTFKMEGGGGAGDIKNQGPTQPDATRELRDFMAAANRRTSDEEFWRENVDLNTYFTFRAVNREVNNMDIRDGWNHYMYRNPETNKYTVIPWDLDMLYIPTTHWSGVIRFENSLRHDAIEVEYKNRARELQDLLFTEDQIGMVVDEIAAVVNPQNGNRTMVDVDQFMWNYNPRTSGDHRGAFNRQTAPYSSIGGDGSRTLVSGDHEGFAQWIKDFMLPPPGGGSEPTAYGWNFLNREAMDADIPETPVISFTGAENFPVDDLRFGVSRFADPQGNATFGAMEWRLGEISTLAAPALELGAPNVYEVETVWTSGKLNEFKSDVTIPGSVVRPGHAYRARVRVLDDTGRASHWSEPIEFIASVGAPAALVEGLRVSEVHYHPAEPTAAEAAAGFTDANEFEFVELVNIGAEPIDLQNAQFMQVDIDGSTQGVGFNFADARVTELDPGQRVVVVENLAAFEFRYGDALPVAGQWSGGLSNSDETITLSAAGVTIQQFAYSDGWQKSTDGGGPSLEIINPLAATETWHVGSAWQSSHIRGGTPGRGPLVVGDSNFDGRFDQSDLILVFQAAEYEDSIPGNSTWETGDWNGDGDFTTFDFVHAFRFGAYVQPPQALKTQSVDLLFERLDARDKTLEKNRPIQQIEWAREFD